MPPIMQPSLFSWQEVESSPDILRFEVALRILRAAELIEELERRRKGKRDDYPIRVLWNSLVAAMIFCVPKFSMLIAELRRNGELRQAVGMDPLRGARAVPPDHVFSRFLGKLAQNQALLERVFDGLVDRLAKEIKDLGAHAAVDSKALLARGARDPDAAKGVKTQTEPDGKTKVTMSWFGYKLHLLCDAVHELPLAFEVTAANVADSPMLLPLAEKFQERHPEPAARMEDLSADRAYDDGADKAALHQEHGVLPIIPARDMRKGRPQPLDPSRHDTIYVSPTGEVLCKIDPLAESEEQRFCAMQYQGHEQEREALKFRCPAAAFGVECKNQAACAGRTKDQRFGRVVRVPLGRDRRLFAPLYAHSQRFKDIYKGRTSIERIFFRLDHLYGFEHTLVRGLGKMRALASVGLSAMLATALGWIKIGRPDKIRCRLQSTA